MKLTLGARSRALSRIGRLEVVIMFDFENCEVIGHELLIYLNFNQICYNFVMNLMFQAEIQQLKIEIIL